MAAATAVDHVASLVHWRLLLVVALQLGPKSVSWRKLFSGEDLPRRVVEIPGALPLFDAHCHLDRTASRLRLSGPQVLLRAGESQGAVSEGGPKAVVGWCVSFCDPETYPSLRDLAEFPANMTVAVGFHPTAPLKNVQRDRAFERLQALLRHPKVTALGEIGLDFKDACEDKHALQVKVARTALRFLEDRHVLVLHCRGVGRDDTTRVYFSMLHLLKQCHVPASQRIQLHCFTGDAYIVERWSESYPESYFSISFLCDSFSEAQKQGIRAVPKDRLLVETDAPYFRSPVYGRQPCSLPGQVWGSVLVLARILSVPAEEVAKLTTRNAKRLFWGQE